MKRSLMLMFSAAAVIFCISGMTWNPLWLFAEDGVPALSDIVAGTNAASGDSAVADYFKGYQPVNSGNMDEGAKIAGPIVNIVGNAVGAILILGAGFIVFVTACDLLYIGVPFTRTLLSKGKFVSDEALQAVPASVGVPGSMPGGINGMSMGGMPGGMPGGMGMGGIPGSMGPGGMPGGSDGTQGQGNRSAIFTYLKRRVVFVVLFGVCCVVLVSSALMGFGINVGQLLISLFEKANSVFG